jgi:hypothetical protein
MTGKHFSFLPDRLCSQDIPQDLALRCWHPPEPGETAPHPLPASWQWLNPHGATWEETYSRADRVGAIHHGGTFSWLESVKTSGLFCVGDDSFGQLGGSAPPSPTATIKDSAFVRGIWPTEFLATGFWHACAFAAPGGMSRGGQISCWGRGDYGQLGIVPKDQCRVHGADIPCARAPVSGIDVTERGSMLELQAGDLFTCMTNWSGIVCWGASRDGLFGRPGSCPDNLKSAWPTLHGSVRAPRASCENTPVPLPGAKGFQPNFQVYPRAICYDHGGGSRCIGPLPEPRGLGAPHRTMSPGSDASACLVQTGRVHCWGEAYSPPGQLDAPVLVELDAVKPIGETAMVRIGSAAAWEGGCLINGSCKINVTPLVPCGDAQGGGVVGGGGAGQPGQDRLPAAVPTWDELLPRADELRDKVVRVRGPLVAGSRMQTLVGCNAPRGKRACCNHSQGSVLLGGGPRGLPLKGLGCSGDESAACCNAPAYGQEVVVTGRLVHDEEEGFSGSEWTLAEPALCAVR